MLGLVFIPTDVGLHDINDSCGGKSTLFARGLVARVALLAVCQLNSLKIVSLSQQR